MVILVRHAEKAKDGGDDPALSGSGAERAKALAAALADSGVTAIVTTQLRRTGDTAAPLAVARGLTPEVVRVEKGEPIPAHAAAVAAAVRRHPGGVVLVVGHSNTVPAIIAALGGPKLPDLADAEYSNLFVLVPGAAQAGPAQLTRTHFGEPDIKAAPPSP
jgi:broad specificity phosphatase PhoE